MFQFDILVEKNSGGALGATAVFLYVVISQQW